MPRKSVVRLYEQDRKFDFGDCLNPGGSNSKRRRKKFIKKRARKRLRKQLEGGKYNG